MKEYVSPEIEELPFISEQLICSSGLTGSPQKGAGWNWDDELY